MGIIFTQYHDQGYFVAKYSGSISDKDLLDSWVEFANSDEWNPQFNELTDLSESDLSNVTPDGIIHLVSYTAKKYKEKGVLDVKVAVYAPAALPYGMSRMYKAYTDDSAENIKIFQNRDEAIQWLTEIC